MPKHATVVDLPLVHALDGCVVHLQPADAASTPAGKLAEAELHFTTGALAGLKLIGFAVWEARSANGRRNVTFPARTYNVNGERRSFALLRAILIPELTEGLRDGILAAYANYEEVRDRTVGSVEADGFVWAPSTAPAGR